MKKWVEKICIECGNKFDTHTMKQKYCSEKCKEKAKRKQYTEQHHKEEKICKICGKIFFAPPKQKYCSRQCCNKVIRERDNSLSSAFLRLRWEIFMRDNFTCQYCGRNVREDHIKIQIDHIIPKSKGGRDVLDNLITTCEECNLGKSDILLDLRIQRKIKKSKNQQGA